MMREVDIAAKIASLAESTPHCGPVPQLLRGNGLSLPKVPPQYVKSLNAFYRRRPALSFTIVGRAATIAAAWPPALRDVPAKRRLDFTMNGVVGEVVLSSALINAVVTTLDPDRTLHHLSPAHAGILIEFALSDAIAVLEASLDGQLAVTAVHTESDQTESVASTALGFAVTVDGLGTSAGELRLPPNYAIKVAQLLDRHGAGFAPAVDLAVAVCVRVASATLCVGEIATLSPGDVVLVDQDCQKVHAAVAVIGEHLVAPVELSAAGGQVAARPQPGQGSLWEWSMENAADTSRPDVLPNPDLDDLPVKLLFELGRVELSLAEVRQLAPGALIPLSRPLEESVDIVANGRRIGRGSLVQIGDSLGIRITRLFGNV